MNIANTDQPISISDLYQQLQVIPTRFSFKPHHCRVRIRTQIIQLAEQIEIQIQVKVNSLVLQILTFQNNVCLIHDFKYCRRTCTTCTVLNQQGTNVGRGIQLFSSVKHKPEHAQTAWTRSEPIAAICDVTSSYI